MDTLDRRNALFMIGAGAASLAVNSVIPAKAAPSSPQWWTPTPHMDAMTAIRTRRSIRSFTEQAVSEELVAELLGAAMSAPSAGNEQPWEFVLIRDKSTLDQIGSINKFAAYAKKAPLAILVCGDLERDSYHGYWIEDVSAATQNLLLAAHALGLGAVWTGVYPAEDRVEKFRELLGLPNHVMPMALVVIGHPLKALEPQNRFDRERIHNERW